MAEDPSSFAHRAGKNRKAVACVIPSAAGFERCLDASQFLGPDLGRRSCRGAKSRARPATDG